MNFGIALLMVFVPAGLMMAPIVWGAWALGLVDRHFAHRSGGERVDLNDRLTAAVMMWLAAILGAFVAETATTAFMESSPGRSSWGGAFAAVATISLLHGLTTGAAWSALEKGVSRGRAAGIAAGAAALWLAGLVLAYITWAEVATVVF